MPWVNDFTVFQYTPGFLRRIAASYHHIYQGIVIRSWTEVVAGEVVERERRIMNPWEIVEYKTDFDNSLKSIGKGKWQGDIKGKFNNYNKFGRLQRIIIADILRIDDNELIRLGFYNIPQLRGYGYFLMVNFLNGGTNGQED